MKFFTARGSSELIKAHTPRRGRPSCRNTAQRVLVLPLSRRAGCDKHIGRTAYALRQRRQGPRRGGRLRGADGFEPYLLTASASTMDGPAGTYYVCTGRAMSLTSGCATRRAAGRATSWTSGRDTRWAAGRSCRTAGCATVGPTSAPPSRWAFRPVDRRRILAAAAVNRLGLD